MSKLLIERLFVKLSTELTPVTSKRPARRSAVRQIVNDDGREFSSPKSRRSLEALLNGTVKELMSLRPGSPLDPERLGGKRRKA